MNLLIDELPKYVDISGQEYKINSDFRTSILFELLMQDSGIDDEEKTFIAIRLYYENEENQGKDFSMSMFKDFIEAMMWFYSCGKERKDQPKGDIQGEAPERKNNIYSFEYDDDYIYSAFLTQYQIDLNNIGYLHWWKFRAMMNGLSPDLQFVKIMGYRSIEITGDMSKSEKKFYTKMKKIYALPDLRTEEEKEADFANSFSM